MIRAKKFIMVKKFKGEVMLSDIRLVYEDIPSLNEDEILLEGIYWSVDPYMRQYMTNYSEGSTMIGGQIAKVIESRSKDIPVGKLVFAQIGWRTHTIVNPKNFQNIYDFYVLDFDFGTLPISLALGPAGMPGNTAYFGLLEICQLKKRETVVISTAAGAVGSLVGQIAKIKGCRVIGLTSSDRKCRWLEDELGFDVAINYKTADLRKALKEAAPKGVDCYFDNVGGEISSIVIEQMNLFGRISVCGAISGYNDQEIIVPAQQKYFVKNQLKMEGFIVQRWEKHWLEGIKQMLDWIKKGKIKYHETITNGFDNMPQSFIDLFDGKNMGKAIVKSSKV